MESTAAVVHIAYITATETPTEAPATEPTLAEINAAKILAAELFMAELPANQEPASIHDDEDSDNLPLSVYLL